MPRSACTSNITMQHVRCSVALPGQHLHDIAGSVAPAAALHQRLGRHHSGYELACFFLLMLMVSRLSTVSSVCELSRIFT